MFEYTVDCSLGYRELLDSFLRQKQVASGSKTHEATSQAALHAPTSVAPGTSC